MQGNKLDVKKITESKWWIAVAFLFSIVRIILTCDLPILVWSSAVHDDALMVRMATNLLSGNWLGNYSAFTMPKGVVYPLYLALIHKSGVSYLLMTQLLYLLSAAIVVTAVCHGKKCYMTACLWYIILIFNPIMSSTNVFLRIYRNILVPIEVLLFFAGILGFFVRLEGKQKHLWIWSVLSGASVLALDMTREDSIWIMPFFVCSSLVFIVMILLQKNHSYRPKVYKLALVVLPFVILIVGNTCVKGLNYRSYGLFACTDTNDTHVTDAIKAMYSVEDPCDIPYVSVSREKMKLLYAHSETLHSVWPCIEEALNEWADAQDGNVTDAHFFWAVRDGLVRAGYYQNAVDTDNFYKDVADELNAALNQGKLAKRIVMPSALMSPWRDGYDKKLLAGYQEAYRFLSSFYSCETILQESDSFGSPGIELFESLTNEKAVYPNSGGISDQKYEKKSETLNVIFTIYSKCNQIVLPIGLVLFLVMTGRLIWSKDYRFKKWKMWLSALGIFLSAFVLVSGVVYTHISAYPAISASYLAGVYPLMLLFEGLVLREIL